MQCVILHSFSLTSNFLFACNYFDIKHLSDAQSNELDAKLTVSFQMIIVIMMLNDTSEIAKVYFKKSKIWHIVNSFIHDWKLSCCVGCLPISKPTNNL